MIEQEKANSPDRHTPDQPRLGILGGGQLSLMLAEASGKMGLDTLILAEDKDSPAAQVFRQCLFGSLRDSEALHSFLSQVHCVVFENEFVNCNALRESSKGRGAAVRFVPSLETIGQVQDKLTQKKLLRDLDIPSADYCEFGSEGPTEKEIRKCLDQFNGKCVLKWARLGYDGKGVLPLQANRLEEAQPRIDSFIKEARDRQSPLFAERAILFKRELALVAVYSTTGEFLSYPLVISEQKKGICSRVYGPATALGVSPRLEELAHEYAKKIAVSLQIYGSFALEFFETHAGEILVNEIAPRVHNSGHYTQDACATDQFENHWRAVLGWKLGKVQCQPAFAWT
jgi:5-(carboxyamino)imidazole ribonucleotide synthase